MELKRLAVLGEPVAHSRSPAMQTAALEAAGLGDDWIYQAIELSAGEFLDHVAEMELDGFVGANVTIPHKEAALAVADQVSEAAAAIGAANTLTFSGGLIRADNTDAPALLAALPASPRDRRALVLGAGGAARAMIWALAGEGAEVEIWNRTAAKADALAEEFGVASVPAGKPPPWATAEIVVNATSIGLQSGDRNGDEAASGFKEYGVCADLFTGEQVVVDLVYGSAETELLSIAKDGGANTIDGLEILIRQGALSFEIWTGLTASLEIMRQAARNPERR